jgi:hypothetical protein
MSSIFIVDAGVTGAFHDGLRRHLKIIFGFSDQAMKFAKK